MKVFKRPVGKCKEHGLTNCPTCHKEFLSSTHIMREVEEATKNLKPVKKKKSHETKDR